VLSSILVASGEIVVVIGGIVGGGGGIAQLPVKMESDERAHYDDIVLPLLSMAAPYRQHLRPKRLRCATCAAGVLFIELHCHHGIIDYVVVPNANGLRHKNEVRHQISIS
jgi:hypothetical protein